MIDYLAFIAYAFNRHAHEGHRSDFEICHRATCRRARQIEMYLILTGQWVELALGWLAVGGRG